MEFQKKKFIRSGVFIFLFNKKKLENLTERIIFLLGELRGRMLLKKILMKKEALQVYE